MDDFSDMVSSLVANPHERQVNTLLLEAGHFTRDSAGDFSIYHLGQGPFGQFQAEESGFHRSGQTGHMDRSKMPLKV